MNQSGGKKSISLALIAALAAVAIVLPFAAPNPYWLHVVILGLIHTLPVLGLTLFMGYAGQLSVGHEALYAIGAYTSGILLRQGFPFVVAFIMAGILPYLAAKALGLAVLKYVKGIYLAPATLGVSWFLNALITNLVGLTGGPSGLTGIPRPAWFQHETQYYFLCLAVVLATYWAISRLIDSRIGIAFRSVAGNDIAAECLGIDVYRYKVFALALSGLCCGLGGALYASYANYICPADFSREMAVRLLCMCIVGGLGNMNGAWMGALALNIVPELLRASNRLQLILYGALLISVLIYWPKGLGGLVDLLPWKRGALSVSPDKPKDATAEGV
ncbi:MAG: branched-chain amino acid ABC transporter permease [Bacillota bacterium]